MNNISKQTLIEKGAIYFDNIEQGFNNYDVSYVEGTSEDIYNQLLMLRDKNGIQYSYVDFYYGILEDEEKSRIKATLSDDLLDILLRYKEIEEVVYLPLDNDLLRLTEKLNTEESLFSTYYFLLEPCTVWGNYDLRYPSFKIKRV